MTDKNEIDPLTYREETPLFEVVCEEPEGTVTRKVYLAKFTPQFLALLWEKQRNFRTLMGREIMTFPEFVDFFVKTEKDNSITPRGLCFVVDDLVGIFWLSDIHAPSYAEVHYTFFDRRHKGRINLCREAIKYCFNNWNFNCLYVGVGLFATIPIRFVESIGFKREGRLRQRLQYKGVWWDVNMYSLLREEVKRFIEIGKWS